MRRRGAFWLLLSVALAAAAVILLLLWGRQELRAAQSVRAALRQVECWPGEMVSSEGVPEDREYIGTLAIPELELLLPVAAQCGDAALEKSPCRYAGSAETGKLVIAGHNYAAHFGPLRHLVGDETVELTDMKGEKLIYRVAKVEILQPWQTEEMVNGPWDLTLFTCTSGGERRLAVRCVQTE